MNIVLRTTARNLLQRFRVHKGFPHALLEWIPHCEERGVGAKSPREG